MAAIKVEFVNVSTVVTDDQVRDVVSALQTQVHRDFASRVAEERAEVPE